jgi:hypothetical protein
MLLIALHRDHGGVFADAVEADDRQLGALA